MTASNLKLFHYESYNFILIKGICIKIFKKINNNHTFYQILDTIKLSYEKLLIVYLGTYIYLYLFNSFIYLKFLFNYFNYYIISLIVIIILLLIVCVRACV